MEVDVLLADAFDYLCRGCPVCEVFCPSCKSVLLLVPLQHAY